MPKITNMLKCILLLLTTSVSLNISAASDPTKPLFGQVASPIAKVKSRLVLQSIIRSKKDYKAVINGKLLRKHDAISGYRIKNITKGKVVLASDEKRIVLSLFTTTKFAKVVNN